MNNATSFEFGFNDKPFAIQDILRVCKDCGLEKFLDDFVKSSSSNKGRGKRCKKCHNASICKERAEATLTQTRLKQILEYSPDTGEFTYLVSRGPKRKGAIAGSFNKDGYRIIRINQRSYRAHRLAYLWMEGVWPPDQIDHDDRHRANNKWGNLNAATPSENSRNCPLRKNNKSGVTGVSYHRQARSWVIAIRNNNGKYERFTRKSFSEAVSLRKALEIEYNYHTNHGSTC